MTARCLLLCLLVPTAARAADLFRDRVAPLLEARCLGCHDAARKRGGLDLSSRPGLLAGGDNGPVVVAKDAPKSRLIQLVSGPSPRMPRGGATLRDADVAALRRWIDAGADWPAGVTLTAKGRGEEETWWSLRRLDRPAIPDVTDREWCRTPVDRFVLAALDAVGLRPSAEADRVTLLRRLSFDLLGLPPSPEAVDRFLADARPDAYARLVDDLLASPAYGERWGRHWLDVAHYGDTHGYDKDKRRDHAWPYRDWVVGGLNADLPARDFIRHQLAGDVLLPGDPRGLIATGFVVAGPWDFVGHVELREGTVDKEKTRVLDRDDMVTNAVGSFMSLTVGCARCHDHKFDPITQKDYYRLQAVFAGVERGPRPLSTAITDARRTLLSEKQRLTGARADLAKRIDATAQPTLKPLDDRLARLREARDAIALPAGVPSPSNGWHSAIFPKPDAVAWVQLDLGSVVAIDAIRLLPARPTDFRDSPGFGFPVRFKIEVADEPTFATPRVVADHTKADYPNPGDTPYQVAVKETSARYVRVTGTRLWKREEDYVFALAEAHVESGGRNVAAGKRVTYQDSIEAGRWGGRYLVDGHDSRRKLPDLGDKGAARRYRERLAVLKDIQDLERERSRELVRLVPPDLVQRRDRLDAELAAVEARLRAPYDGPTVYTVQSIAPRPIRVLKRGDVEQPRDEVPPGGLVAVSGLDPDFSRSTKDDGARRLALADWIASERNPLTWRSLANRLWHYHFGKGLVDTPNDFGKMGSLPTHPELLDYLAVELRETGSLKHLHRLIVTSAAYRQASGHDDRAARLDADNRYLWRMTRRRLDAEGIRDAVLAVSGRLDRSMGGPGYALFRFKDDHSPVYDHADRDRLTDPATYRRTVYRFTVRSVPNPFLDCLDSADPNLPTPVRNSTLTALQALALLNNPFMVRQAGHFAERLQAEADGVPAQVELAYRLAFARSPTPEERDAVVAHARRHGLAAACRVVLNANEFVFVD